ncbi:hypothetical protein KFE25_005043 [Diacronema lutheri]|uniref:Uncharacterized protein n=1 Tax=Diacronema lutheri TaxID=2081491 RepID=A0A8J5X705_DIALT|nr:hypothetical protein KFE25_005043 [Diacronema lutheri]
MAGAKADASRAKQLASDAQAAAALQRELDEEAARDAQDELDDASGLRARRAALDERLNRSAGKEITHLGKATLRRIDDKLHTGVSLRGVLNACRDDARFAALLELVDAGQRERVYAEAVALLLDEELVASL